MTKKVVPLPKNGKAWLKNGVITPRPLLMAKTFQEKEPPSSQSINTKATPAKLHHQFPPQHISGTEDLSSEIELANYFPLCIPIPHLSSHSLYPSPPPCLGQLSHTTAPCLLPALPTLPLFQGQLQYNQVILEMVSTSMECCASPFFYLLWWLLLPPCWPVHYPFI